MNVVTMQHSTDCEVAALATACQCSYDKAKSALNWADLPGGLENPVFGNPLNLHRALLRLGFWKINRTFGDIVSGKCAPGKTVILVKKSVTQQHWCVLASAMNGLVGLYMGKKPEPTYYTVGQFKEMFTCDGPVNEAFEVYKCSIWRVLWEKIKGLWKK